MQPASAPPTENATAAAPQKTRGLLNVSDDREVPLGTGSERASLAAESWLQYESRCVPLTPHPASAPTPRSAPARSSHPLHAPTDAPRVPPSQPGLRRPAQVAGLWPLAQPRVLLLANLGLLLATETHAKFLALLPLPREQCWRRGRQRVRHVPAALIVIRWDGHHNWHQEKRAGSECQS